MPKSHPPKRAGRIPSREAAHAAKTPLDRDRLKVYDPVGVEAAAGYVAKNALRLRRDYTQAERIDNIVGCTGCAKQDAELVWSVYETQRESLLAHPMASTTANIVEMTDIIGIIAAKADFLQRADVNKAFNRPALAFLLATAAGVSIKAMEQALRVAFKEKIERLPPARAMDGVASHQIRSVIERLAAEHSLRELHLPDHDWVAEALKKEFPYFNRLPASQINRKVIDSYKGRIGSGATLKTDANGRRAIVFETPGELPKGRKPKRNRTASA